MATALMIRGELEHDIGLLRAEVRRIVSVSRDLKGRRKKLTEDAEKDEKAFISDYQNLTNRALSPSDFNSRTKGRLTYVERELRSFVIEDTVFEKELEKAKAILEQFKSQFPQLKSLIRIAEAETNILMTEDVYLVARLTACKEFIQQKLDPLINSNNLASQAQQLNHAFSEICEFAREIDDITLKAMSKILKFYVSLINSYPQLVHEAWEKERWGKNKRRMLE